MRLVDWRVRLNDLIARKENEPFLFGKNDCALFGADVVLALTGNDLAAKYRGKYRSLSGGIKLIRKDGYKSQIDFVIKNFEEIPVAFAGIGDLGVTEQEGEKILSVICGDFSIAIGEYGLTRFPTEKVLKAYRV